MCSKCGEPKQLTAEQKLVFDKIREKNEDVILISGEYEGEQVGVITLMEADGLKPLAIIVNDTIFNKLQPPA